MCSKKPHGQSPGLAASRERIWSNTEGGSDSS
jgi:hypothetical protein